MKYFLAFARREKSTGCGVYHSVSIDDECRCNILTTSNELVILEGVIICSQDFFKDTRDTRNKYRMILDEILTHG